jgi:transposase
VRPKYVLKKDKQREAEENNQETPAIKTAPLPLMPLPRSNAGPSLLAELLLGKYMYHQPFHRQISMMKLTGMHLPASTVNGWFMGSCDLLRALYYRLKDLVFASDYIQVDESTVPVIDNEKHRTVKAYLWMVRSVMEKLVFFITTKGPGPKKSLSGYYIITRVPSRPTVTRPILFTSTRRVCCCSGVGHMPGENLPKRWMRTNLVPNMH